MGIGVHGKTARKKVTSTEHSVKVEIYSQGGGRARFQEVELVPGLFWDLTLLGVSGLGGAVTEMGGLSRRLLPVIWKTPPTGEEGSF